MFAKLSTLLALVPLATALTLQTPSNIHSSSSFTLTWTADSTDQSFSLYLINTVFNNNFGIANNVDPSLGSLTINLGVVPVGDGYTIEAVNIGNVTDVYASTSDFSIAAAPSTTASSTSSVSGASTASAVSTSLSVVPSASVSGSGSATRTSSGASSGTSAASSTSQAPTTSASGGFSSGAGSIVRGSNAAYAAVLGAIAGAAVIAA